MAGECSDSLDAQPASCHGEKSSPKSPSWSDRYGARHRLARIAEFPVGVEPPRRVRLYGRLGHYILQWWDRRLKKTLSERVDGDLIDAIARARQIDERLAHFRTAGHRRPIGHQELVDAYLADLRRRADAGEIDPRTVTRYASALANYYLPYALRPDVERQFRHAAAVNREFALGFSAYLNIATVTSKGNANGNSRPMRGQDYVALVIRGMFQWAADPDRGDLLPDGFRNPFLFHGQRRSALASDLLGEPDITLTMAADFLSACDLYQLRLFAPMIFYGLRAAEPCFLFAEDVNDGWLKVLCRPELAYQTKGRRDKRLPLIACITDVIGQSPPRQPGGLLYRRRKVEEGCEKPRLLNAPLATIVGTFERRCAAAQNQSSSERRRIRDQVLLEAGGVTYDNIRAEFQKITARLGWPVEATLKDFRHLAATCMENAGVPEYYRRYLLGQSTGRAAIVTYTHLNELRERYEEAVQRKFRPLVDALVQRTQALKQASLLKNKG